MSIENSASIIVSATYSTSGKEKLFENRSIRAVIQCSIQVACSLAKDPSLLIGGLHFGRAHWNEGPDAIGGIALCLTPPLASLWFGGPASWRMRAP